MRHSFPTRRSADCFEIEHVSSAVRKLVEEQSAWSSLKDMDDEEFPTDQATVDLKLSDGSILLGASYERTTSAWVWRGLDVSKDVIACRSPRDEPETQ